MNYNPQDYEEVKDRIPKFLDNMQGKGRIITHLVSSLDDLSTVVFKAELYCEETLLATGWAHERAGEGGPVNRTCHLENCETSAIGRALANLGIHGDKRPSREEMHKAQRHEEMPPPNGNISEKQGRMLHAKCKEAELDIKQLMEHFGFQHVSEIPKDKFSEILGKVNARIKTLELQNQPEEILAEEPLPF